VAVDRCLPSIAPAQSGNSRRGLSLRVSSRASASPPTAGPGERTIGRRGEPDPCLLAPSACSGWSSSLLSAVVPEEVEKDRCCGGGKGQGRKGETGEMHSCKRRAPRRPPCAPPNALPPGSALHPSAVVSILFRGGCQLSSQQLSTEAGQDARPLRTGDKLLLPPFDAYFFLSFTHSFSAACACRFLSRRRENSKSRTPSRSFSVPFHPSIMGNNPETKPQKTPTDEDRRRRSRCRIRCADVLLC